MQLENLSLNAAKQIETWLKRQNDTLGWFEDDGAARRRQVAIRPQRAAPRGALCAADR